MYWNTKEYMSDHLVRPVLKRADSVKQIGNAVLESPITTFAAERLDGALTVGDKFVDKYLIPIDGEADQTDGKQTLFCKYYNYVHICAYKYWFENSNKVYFGTHSQCML